MKVNPARLASALLLISSPFMTWVTIVSVVIYQGVIVFGTAAQSNLMMISAQQLGANVSAFTAEASTLAMVLLVASGFAVIKAPRLGVPLGVAAVASYLIPMYSLFGQTDMGLQETFISPGIGLFVSGAGVVLGAVSHLSKPNTPRALVASMKTGAGLVGLGVPLAVTGLVLDVSNHIALGQLPDFIGQMPLEQFLHLGLVSFVGATLMVFALKGHSAGSRYLLVASVGALALLSADAAYSSYIGSLHEFLGHNPTETALHLSVYYGIALTAIGGFLGLRNAKSPPVRFGRNLGKLLISFRGINTQ